MYIKSTRCFVIFFPYWHSIAQWLAVWLWKEPVGHKCPVRRTRTVRQSCALHITSALFLISFSIFDDWALLWTFQSCTILTSIQELQISIFLLYDNCQSQFFFFFFWFRFFTDLNHVKRLYLQLAVGHDNNILHKANETARTQVLPEIRA